jgi:hypothetical protein
MKVTMTKGKIVEIAKALATIKSENKMLTYAIIKNKKAIESEVEALNEALKLDSDDYIKYVTEIREVANKYGAKDEDGNIIPTPTGFRTVDGTDQEEVQSIVNEINEKYKEVIEAREKQMEEYNNMLNDEVEIEFSPIKLANMPDTVEEKTISLLFDIIEE